MDYKGKGNCPVMLKKMIGLFEDNFEQWSNFASKGSNSGSSSSSFNSNIDY